MFRFAVALSCLLLLANAAMAQSRLPQNAVDEGIALYRQGAYGAAAERFRSARPAQMTKGAYLAWGMASYRMGKYRSAAAKFAQAAAKDHADGDPLALMGDSYLRAGEPAEALRAFTAIGEKRLTDKPQALILWGSAANAAGNHPMAEERFAEAERISPPERSVEITLGRAEAAMGMGRHDRAEAFARTVLARANNHPGGLFLLGSARLKGGGYGAAIDALEQALAAGAPVGPTAYNLACAYALSGEWENGCAALERSCGAGFDCLTPAADDADLADLRQRSCYRRLTEKR
jgi:tetratricopeptide (TPR) repeat protein